MKRWHVVQTLPRKEAFAAEHLTNAKFDVGGRRLGDGCSLLDLRVGDVVAAGERYQPFEVWDLTFKELDVSQRRRNDGGKRHTVERQLFPGYLLVRFDAMIDAHWWRVLRTPGVRGMFTVGGAPAPLPEKAVEIVRKALAMKRGEADEKINTPKGYLAGDQVEVISDPVWWGHVGRLAAAPDAKGRVELLLSILGAERRLVTSVGSIRPV